MTVLAPPGACPECGTPSSEPRCHQCGVALVAGGFQVLRVIAQGASSRMYLAQGPDGQKVALKELVFAMAPEAAQIDAFERETKLLAQLSHTRIPRFLQSFREGKGVDLRLYLAQEFVEGESLLQRLEHYRFTEAEVLGIARQVLPILIWLHRRAPPILHRDIKPANLIVRPDGQLMLVDFGVARAVEKGATHRATLVGTFGYMPPEQLGGTVDATSDLYALGATLLHLLTRKPPEALLTRDMALAFDEQLAVSPQTRAFLSRLTALRREDRFPSAVEALRALDSPSAVTPPSQTKTSSRRILGLLLGGASLVAAFSFAMPHLMTLADRRPLPPGPKVMRPRLLSPTDWDPHSDEAQALSAAAKNCFLPRDCTRRCEAGEMDACHQLGVFHEHGSYGIRPDAKQAIALFEKSCEGGSMKGCSTLAHALSSGRMVEKNPERAAALHAKACEAGNAYGCYGLGFLYKKLKPELASVYLKKACDMDYLSACTELAKVYRIGIGVPVDRDKMKELLEHACQRQDNEACNALSNPKAWERSF